MAVESSSPAFVQSRTVQPSPVVTADAAFEERWAGWRARGLDHDRVVQRRNGLIALVVVIGAGLVMLGVAIAGGSR